MPQPLEGCSSGLLLSEWIPCGSFEQRQRIRVGDRGGGDHQDVDCDWIAGYVYDLGQANEVKLEIICTIKPWW